MKLRTAHSVCRLDICLQTCLFLNHTTIVGARPQDIEEKTPLAWDFWRAVTSIPGVFERKQSVAAQSAMLKSIARVYYDLLWARNAPTSGATNAKKFLGEGLAKIDFSHTNPLWNIQHMSDEDIKKTYPKLLNYLPANWREKSVADVVDGEVRFSSRHNESILVLPGILRYLSGVPINKNQSKRSKKSSE